MSGRKTLRVAIGPFSGVTTGQSAVSLEAASDIKASYLLDVGGVGVGAVRKIACFLHNLIRLASLSVYAPYIECYGAPSRSTLGFWREAPLFLMILLFQNRLILHLHGLDLRPFYYRSGVIQRWFIRYVYSRSEVIVLFEEMAAQVEFARPKALHILPNYASEVPLHVLIAEEDKPKKSNKIKVLWASHLVFEKGLDVFLEALETSLDAEVFVEINVVGSVLDEGYFEEVQAHPSWTCVTYHGEVSQITLLEMMQMADVFVFSSRHPTECFPMVLLEAALAECHILCSRLNFIPRVFEDFDFRFFDVGDSEQLSGHLKKLLTEDVRDAKKNNSYCAKRFSREKFRHELQSIMDDHSL